MMTERQDLILRALACAAGEWSSVGREGGLLEMLDAVLAAKYREDAARIEAWAAELRREIARRQPDREESALEHARDERGERAWRAA